MGSLRSGIPISLNKHQRIPKGQSIMDNPEKLATQGTQDDVKHNTLYAGHHIT